MNDKEIKLNGRWITAGEILPFKPQNVYHRQLDRSLQLDATLQNRHILFRKAFDLKEAPQKATLTFSADDYAKIYINGVFVTQGPGSGYPMHYLCQTEDVTKYLHAGRNVIAFHSYYQGLINRVYQSGDNRHGVIADLHCDFADGSVCLLATDESFLCHPHTGFSSVGLAGYSTQFLERYDASAAEYGFEQPDFDDSKWAQARLVPSPDYKLFNTPLDSLVFEEATPAVLEKRGGCIFIDFGAMYVGRLAMTATGRAGDTIEMRFGQELNADGTVRWQMRCNCNYKEYFVLSGREGDKLNQWDYKSFRYVELYAPAGVCISDVKLVAQHMPFQLKAKCKYTDKAAQDVWNLCVRSFQVGVQEQIQDCMDREKGYYLGDGCYTMLTFCTLTDNYVPMLKFFDDFLRTSFINGGLVTCGNCSHMQEIAEYPFMLFILIPTLVEKGYGDFIKERMPQFRAILEYYRKAYSLENGLLSNLDKWCVVEWPKNMQDGYDADVSEGKVCTALHNVINAWYLGAVKIYNKYAVMYNEPAFEYDALFKAFVETFYDREAHLFKDSAVSSHISFPGNIYAWFLGLIPEQEFVAKVLEMVRHKRLSSGMLFIFFPLFSALRSVSEEELIHSLITDDNTWHAMLREGATTTFEAWTKDTKWNTSLFHLTLASAAYFMI